MSEKSSEAFENYWRQHDCASPDPFNAKLEAMAAFLASWDLAADAQREIDAKIAEKGCGDPYYVGPCTDHDCGELIAEAIRGQRQ